MKGTSADSFLAKTRLVAVDARDVREIVEYSSLAIAYWRVSQSSTRLYHSQPAPAGNLHVPVRALQEGSQRLRCVTSSARPSRCTSTSPQSPFHYRHTPPLRELLSLASPCLTLSLSTKASLVRRLSSHHHHHLLLLLLLLHYHRHRCWSTQSTPLSAAPLHRALVSTGVCTRGHGPGELYFLLNTSNPIP